MNTSRYDATSMFWGAKMIDTHPKKGVFWVKGGISSIHQKKTLYINFISTVAAITLETIYLLGSPTNDSWASHFITEFLDGSSTYEKCHISTEI